MNQLLLFSFFVADVFLIVSLTCDCHHIRSRRSTPFNWTYPDRREEEGWWHLYPFGEKYFDTNNLDHSWQDKQIDLDFLFPYFGYRFNYSFIYPDGFISFSKPRYIQPPYTFPNTRWPNVPDPSFVAAFMTEQSFVFIGDRRFSNVWYRILSRPINNHPFVFGPSSDLRNYFYDGQYLKVLPGRVEDPYLLEQITKDIQEGMVGAKSFRAEYALVLTWERMGYGGTPRYLQLDEFQAVKRWQNTYQLVLATDEIRSYVIFNYANLNWTTGASSGGFSGRGGKQSALIGFNGGNGTGFVELPYSAEGNSYKLTSYGSANVKGRWLARVDEEIQYGGCSNITLGKLSIETDAISMLGGHAINVSGPCFREDDLIKLQIEEIIVDCQRISMIKARCILPTDTLFRAGNCPVGLSTNNGLDYRWWSTILIVSPDRTPLSIKLLNDPVNLENHWRSSDANNLTLKWSPTNITTKPYTLLDISLWGYTEDATMFEFSKISMLASNLANTGIYNFNPNQLVKECLTDECWKKFYGGVLQISVPNWDGELGDGVFWSERIPFNWFFHDMWQEQYGQDWALKRCLEWFEYDGLRKNFIMDVESWRSCPCVMSQGLADFGRFITIPSCDNDGDTSCFYGEGAAHCLVSTSATVFGAAQVCCYDDFGYLMFSQDYEYNTHYIRFFGAGTPYRAHPWGVFPYRRPPYIPAFSNFVNDLLPYESCCLWAGHCEFYFWRRMSSGCQGYEPTALAYAYGMGHFTTFDGLEYTFCGQGYYVLTEMTAKNINLMVQIRMEQPPQHLAPNEVKCSVITGVAAQDNSSSVVQVFARKQHRRWRYKTDVYVDGMRVFMDQLHKKRMLFNDVAVRSAALNMDMSVVEITFATGVGIRVTETDGSLQIAVAMPPEYKQKSKTVSALGVQKKCELTNKTYGLFGTYNHDKEDDLTNNKCQIVEVGDGTPGDVANIFYNFGQTWRVGSILFDIKFYSIYNPTTFWDVNYLPTFDLTISNETFWRTVDVSKVELSAVCHESKTCQVDFYISRSKEYAAMTSKSEKEYRELKENGETYLVSCGPLEKGPGVLKYPAGKNYLDGSVVNFMCKPEFYLHGDPVRRCNNGRWTLGWPVWCRRREHEIALKWLTGITISVGILTLFILLFCWFAKKRRIMIKVYAAS